jgi:hypothetical protein
MAEQHLPAEMADNLADFPTVTHVVATPRPRPDRTESDLILDILARCARTFGTERARFVRQLPGREWQVHAIQHQDGPLITHFADHAEIAMAWAVGLSRFPIRVTRPRVTLPDGTGVRPIAVSGYFGIPVLCGDHFVGVIELAGSVSGELERSLETLRADLRLFGNRLTHDSSIRVAQHVDPEVECWLDGGCWFKPTCEVTSDEWRFLAQLGEPLQLQIVADRLAISGDQAVSLARSLLGKGLISVRASTRPLDDPSRSGDGSVETAAGD